MDDRLERRRRGDLDGLDLFHSSPMIHSEDIPVLEKLREGAKELLERHVGIKGKDTRVMDWRACKKADKLHSMGDVFSAFTSAN